MSPNRRRKVSSNSTDYQVDEDIPQERLKRKRFCTDIPCCIIFLVFIICFVMLSIFAFKEGDPRQLIHPTDSYGNLCGTGEHLQRAYVYFFDWTKCIKSLNIPSNMLNGRPFICPTTQVCVAQCPNTTTYYTFKNYGDHRICTYDVNETNQTHEALVKDGKCAPYIIASKPLFGRCVPEAIQGFVNNIIEADNGSGMIEPLLDSDEKPLNGSKLEQGVKYLVDLLNLKQIGVFLVEDFVVAWPFILIGLAIAALVSFIWIVLMRWLAKPIVWLGILLFILLWVVISVLSFLEFIDLRRNNANQIWTGFQFVTDATYYRSLPITWLVIAIISTLFLVISLLILLVLFKRLRIALAILQEASKAVGYNFFSLFWPIFPFLLQIGVIAYWTVVAVYLATAGKPIYRITFDANMTDSTDFSSGDICDPKRWNSTVGECVFWEYGYDPQVDLDSILSGTDQHFKSFIRFVNENQWVVQLYSAFMLFWLTAFVVAFGQLVLAGVYARYYWDQKRVGIPCSALTVSFIRAFVFHLGTVAFGSLLVAIVKLIRAMLEYIEKKVKDKTGGCARCLFCCCRCCLFCLEKFLKFLNRNAYIVTAIYGTGFFTSARRAFAIIISNPLRLLVIDKVCDFLIFLGKVCITAGIGILAFFFFTHRIAKAENYVPELHYYFIPLLLIVIGSYIVATCFFSVYSMAVDTLFICALEDIRLQEKNANHQLMMPKGLRKVFRINKKK